MSVREWIEEVSTKQERIAHTARNHAGESLKSVSHYIDLKWLYVAYLRTRKDGAVGIDGVTAEMYAENLKENLERLLDAFKSGRYRAPAVRRVQIPKGTKGNETRPLSIPSFEDKVLQRAVLMVLEPIVETEFHEFSHGFRPKHSAHLALEEFWQKCQKMGGGWLIDMDIRKYFDTIDHRHLREMVRARVCDGVITRMIGKWLKAGILEDGSIIRPTRGTQQGGVLSPLLSNLYLHEVLDSWYVETVQPRLKSTSFMVRFADDALLMCRSKEDAQRIMEVLPKRFEKFGLQLHPEKTKLVDFCRPSGGNRNQRKETFTFLGFTHYWKKSRKGFWVVGRKTEKSRLTRSLKAVTQWCRRNRHKRVREQWKHLCRVIKGHYAYYGITGNYRRLNEFHHLVKKIWHKWLNRRSRSKCLNWERFNAMMKYFTLPSPRIVHSYIAKL